MTSYSYIVLTKCTPGHEAEFDRWYDDVHIPDLLRIPGIVSAMRGKIADVQTTMAEAGLRLTATPSNAYPFMAIYGIRSDNPGAVLADLISRANTPAMMLSEYLEDAFTVLYENL